MKRLRTGIEVDRDERREREGVPAMTMAEKREGYSLFEAEEKTNTFCRQLQEQRQKRQEGKFNRVELIQLREENKLLQERCQKYERLLETSGDPEILRKFFEIEQRKEMMEECKKEAETKSKELEIMKEQYDAMKKSQLTLTDMNKKLID